MKMYFPFVLNFEKFLAAYAELRKKKKFAAMEEVE